MVSTINTATFFSDTTVEIRDDLRTNITDPITSSRVGNFILSAFPQQNVQYPIVTVQNTNVETLIKLGMGSEKQFISIPLEVRIWARNVKERDFLTQDIINRFRSAELGATGTVEASLYDMRVTSAVNVDDVNSEGKVVGRSRVIEVEYRFILG